MQICSRLAASGSSAFKVSQYYHTDWIESDQLPLRMEGHSLDAVYENFVRQCRGSVECEEWSVELSVAENVERDLRRQQLQKQITALENKIRKEKQLNRQVEINVNIKKLKRELEML